MAHDDRILGVNPVLLGSGVGLLAFAIKNQVRPELSPASLFKGMGRWSVVGAFVGAGVGFARRQKK